MTSFDDHGALPIRILLLEDDPLDAELAERHLQRGGFAPSMTRVWNESSFRTEIASGHHELVIADYHLPGFNGMKALEITQELAPELPFIFMSGSLGEERAVEALKLGATDYIVKDRPSRLGAAVRGALKQRREALARVEREERIRHLSRINRLILVYAAEGILAVTREGVLLFANPAAETMLGWSDETSITDVHATLHADEADGSCPFAADLRGETSRASETIFVTQSGSRMHVRYTAAAIVDDGEVTGSVITFADITERKRLEHQLEQANRVRGLGQVAATIAHEFNNVLMGIQPFTEVIRRRSEDERVVRAASQIAASVTRGKRVTEEILRFTQPAEPALQVVSVAEWLQHLLPELKGLVGERIEIEIDVPDASIALSCDPAQLQQVMTNLIVNARDAIRDKGLIRISVPEESRSESLRVPHGMVLLRVEDNGCGMTGEVLDHIFDPLYTTKRTGTGLGLAVAQQIIRGHGGSISPRSLPGLGTTFDILLPAANADPPVGSETKGSPRVDVRRIVLVEDEDAIASGIVMLLESEGVAVKAVALGGDAMSAIEDFLPDAVILDMSLPDMDGATVFRRIADAWPSLPVLFSSGHGDQSSVEAYIEKGHAAFLRKPYDFDQLLEALGQLVQQAKEKT